MTIDGKFQALDSTAEPDELPHQSPNNKRIRMNPNPLSMPRLTAMINDALSQHASDIHLSISGKNVRVFFSIHGYRSDPLLSPTRAQSIVNEIQHTLFDHDDKINGGCADAKFDMVGLDDEMVRVRLALIPTLQGWDIFMKLLSFSRPTTPVKLEDLGYSEKQVREIKDQQSANDIVMAGRIGVLRIE